MSIKSYARLKSSLSYYEVNDTYNVPEILRKARSKFDQQGLPIAPSPEPNAYSCSSIIQPNQKLFKYKNQDEDGQFVAAVSSCTGIFQMAFHRLLAPFSRLLAVGNCDTLRTQRNVHPIPVRSCANTNNCQFNIKATGPGSDIDVESNQNHHYCTERSESPLFIADNTLSASARTGLLPHSTDPPFKTYQVEPEPGVKMNVMEISLVYKKTVFENFLAERQDLKSLVLSKKCASLIWIWSKTTRIVIIAESNECGTWSLKQWYSKILSDMSLADSILVSHSYYWHPVVRRRLSRSIRHFKMLHDNLDTQEGTSLVPSIIASEKFISVGACLAPSNARLDKLCSTTPTMSDDPTDLDTDSVFTSKEPEFEYVNIEDNTKITVSRPPENEQEEALALGTSCNMSSTCSKNITNEMYQKWSHYSATFNNNNCSTNLNSNHGNNIPWLHCGVISMSPSNSKEFKSESLSSQKEDFENFLKNPTNRVGVPPEDSISMSLGPDYKVKKLTRNSNISLNLASPIVHYQLPVPHGTNIASWHHHYDGPVEGPSQCEGISSASN